MNLLVICIILVALVGFSFFKIPTFLWIIIWLVAVYLSLTSGMSVPIPSSVIGIYMGLTALGLLVYVLTDAERYNTVRSQLFQFIVAKQNRLALNVTVALLPILLAAKIYFDMNVAVHAPGFSRTIHPAPPGSTNFKGKEIDLIRGKNPFRELQSKDPAAYQQHVDQGKIVYFKNCVFCHGDDLRGDGMFAHALNPVPANFNSATTIGMLQEGYLFWRIAKGGPGLPDESGPWSSSMPAWEKFLQEDEIWNVILFLYEHTGLKPRAEEEEHH